MRIGERRSAGGAGIEDESCGYHPATVWDWSAGVGELSDGRSVGWNLVSGINDPPERSERAIWVDGTASEPGPCASRASRRSTSTTGRLEFSARCERRKEERRPSSYTYRQPFGSFSGTLPGGLELERGLGVMEHHDAHW